MAEGQIDICSGLFGSTCKNALVSPYSTWIKLPLAGWSILFYCMLFLFSTSPFLFGHTFKKMADLLTLSLSFCSVIVAFLLIGLMIFQPSLFCPFCTVLHIINLGLFFMFFYLDGSIVYSNIKNRVAIFLNPAFKFRNYFNVWHVFVVFVVASCFFSIVWLLQTAVLNSKHTSALIDLSSIISNYDQQPVQLIQIHKEDVQMGNSKSPLKLVFFSDFFCPGCKLLSEEINEICLKYRDSCSIVFKYFPLSNSCNPAANTNLHPFACDAAYAAEAANRCGKFQIFQDSLFFYNEAYTDKAFLRKLALKCDLPIVLYDSLILASEVAATVQRSIAEGNRLKLQGTPAVFLNGKRVMNLQKGILEFLVEMELEKGRELRLQK